MTIAGARLKEVSLEEAVNMLRNAIDENLKESEKK
jgi:c-di-AMP phosphodiesterase-like protein